MTQLAESWDSCRRPLLEAMLSREGCIGSCSNCFVSSAVIRCTECRKVFCTACDQHIHESLPLHDREAFIDVFFTTFIRNRHLKT